MIQSFDKFINENKKQQLIIPTADISIYREVKSGKLSLKDAAIEFCKLGWTNFIDIDATKRYLKRAEEKESKIIKEHNNTIIQLGVPEDGDLYYVEIGEWHNVMFDIYASDPQSAMDIAVDYAEEQGWDGLFSDNDEIANEYPDDFVIAGNKCHKIRIDNFIIKRK